MVYGYIRVSTDKQTVQNQKFEILRYTKRHKIKIDKWIAETISGTVSPSKRTLGRLLGNVKKGDLIICSELSRLGRSMFMIMSILNRLMEDEVLVYTVKEGYKLGTDLTSKVLAFAFSISAEIERTLISDRTREALRRKKSEGAVLGRPRGKLNSHYKLSPYENEIISMLSSGFSKKYISVTFHVTEQTLYNFLKRHGIVFRNKL
ncbi:master DNA invertase Mpi family serine-type recombinase [Treponema sp. C6A8]|uniref:master DNA invertase Mpi family serine-type recombinase n=1 Tax=Treponema sp. C6A8 TaxID=1410609 RepID=UPI0004836124|nr:master DNA invertase Mpi family serine-type recombinase [Treponema sp. C6A8]